MRGLNEYVCVGMSGAVIVALACLAYAQEPCYCDVCGCLDTNCHGGQDATGVSCVYYVDVQAQVGPYVWGSAIGGCDGTDALGPLGSTSMHRGNNCISYCFSNCPGEHEASCSAGLFLGIAPLFFCDGVFGCGT